MVSSTILNSPGSRVQDQPYRGTFTLLKRTTIYPGPHDLVRHSLSRLELVHSNSEGSGELPSRYLLPVLNLGTIFVVDVKVVLYL